MTDKYILYYNNNNISVQSHKWSLKRVKYMQTLLLFVYERPSWDINTFYIIFK